MNEAKADRKDPAKRRRPTTRTDPEEQAAILAYSKLHGTPKAAEKFGISTRAVERWRQQMRAGKAPELAALVEAQRAEQAKRHGDLIFEATEDLLQELRERRGKLTNSELIEAVDKVGRLRLERDFMRDSEEPALHVDLPRPNQSPPGDEEAEDQAPRRTGEPPSRTSNGHGEPIRH